MTFKKLWNTRSYVCEYKVLVPAGWSYGTLQKKVCGSCPDFYFIRAIYFLQLKIKGNFSIALKIATVVSFNKARFLSTISRFIKKTCISTPPRPVSTLQVEKKPYTHLSFQRLEPMIIFQLAASDIWHLELHGEKLQVIESQRATNSVLGYKNMPLAPAWKVQHTQLSCTRLGSVSALERTSSLLFSCCYLVVQFLPSTEPSGTCIGKKFPTISSLQFKSSTNPNSFKKFIQEKRFVWKKTGQFTNQAKNRKWKLKPKSLPG